MSEGILSADHLLADLARLTSERDAAVVTRDQALRAREIAEARLYAYGDHQSHCATPRGPCTCGYARITETTPRLLAELDAARVLIDMMRGELPGSLLGKLEAYDAAVKVRNL